MENDFFERAGILVTWKDYTLARLLQLFLLEHRVSTKPVMVAGLFPFGCTSKIMTMFKTEDENRYDSKTGCIKWVNDFAEHHNDLLKIQLSRLKQLHPHANIIYADYYTSAIPAYVFPEEFGFNVTLVACCGSGGEYNFDSAAVCGQAGSTLCDDPSSYVSWDGVHMTEAANRVMAEGLLKGSSLCNCAAGSVLPPTTSFNYKDALVYQCNFSCLLWSGDGGQYNFSPDIVCGNEAFMVCEDPSSYIYFDGLHRTEAALRIMALGLPRRSPHKSPAEKELPSSSRSFLVCKRGFRHCIS